MTRRTHRIVVKCHDDELSAIQAKATSLGKEAATYLRELGLAEASLAEDLDDQVQRQLYWLAGSLHDVLNSWAEQHSNLPLTLADSMQLTVQALRQLQQAALLDKLPPHQLNINFSKAIAQVQNARQRD